MPMPNLAPSSQETPLYLREPAKKFFSFVGSAEQFLREIRPPSVSNLSFEINGILFKARHEPINGTSRLTIWGELGYLPFTVSSREKRRNLISIFEGTHALPHVKFGIDARMRILATGEYKITNPLAPDYLFVPLVRFCEESMPFIRLIGDYL